MDLQFQQFAQLFKIVADRFELPRFVKVEAVFIPRLLPHLQVSFVQALQQLARVAQLHVVLGAQILVDSRWQLAVVSLARAVFATDEFAVDSNDEIAKENL